MKIITLVWLLGLIHYVPVQDDWYTLSAALPMAAQEHKPVFVYISAPWCGPCHTMEKQVFPQAAPLLERFIKVKIRYDDHDNSIRVGQRVLTPFAWAQHLGIEATPGFVVLDHQGSVLLHHTGLLDTKSFNLLLAYIATDAYKHASFEAYMSNHG